MMKIIVLLICVLSLTACHVQMLYPPMAKDGASEQQRKTDAFECKTLSADFKSKHLGGGSPSFGVFGLAGHKRQLNDATAAANEYYIECMELRGHKVISEKENK